MADSFGTKMWIKKVADSTWFEVACVIEGDAFKAKKTVTERKCLGQTSRYTTKRGTFIDGGQQTLKVAFAKAKFTKLKEWFDDPAPWDYRIEVPDEDDTTAPIDVTRFAAQAVLTDLGQPLPADGGRLETDLTMDVSGAVSFTEATTATS